MAPHSFVRGLGILTTLAAFLSACAHHPSADLVPLHQATVLIEHAKGHGTGTILSRHAVLTAYHVVQNDPLAVRFFEGPSAPGQVVWSDPVLDLALVGVEVPDGYPAPGLACEELHPGQHLVSIGHPTQSRWVAVGGYLPAIEPFGGGLVSLGFPIGLGTSGGPVFDADGRVVGVALAILAERVSASAAYDRYKDTGIGLMLPAKDFCTAIAASYRRTG
jgi:S1-C subfamily serine protease